LYSKGAGGVTTYIELLFVRSISPFPGISHLENSPLGLPYGTTYQKGEKIAEECFLTCQEECPSKVPQFLNFSEGEEYE
jgi:hypothetical protein